MTSEAQEAQEGPTLGDGLIEVPDERGGFNVVQGPVQTEQERVSSMISTRDALYRLQDNRWNTMVARMEQDAMGEEEDRAANDPEDEDEEDGGERCAYVTDEEGQWVQDKDGEWVMLEADPESESESDLGSEVGDRDEDEDESADEDVDSDDHGDTPA